MNRRKLLKLRKESDIESPLTHVKIFYYLSGLLADVELCDFPSIPTNGLDWKS